MLRRRSAVRVIGGIRFYDRAEVKDLLAYLRVIANPADEVSLERIVNKPTRGIGDTTVREGRGARARRARHRARAPMRAVAAPSDGALAAGPRKKLGAFVELIEELRGSAASLGGLAEQCSSAPRISSGWRPTARTRAQERIENLMELVGSIETSKREAEAQRGRAADADDYLERVSLVSPADEKPQGVTLMTVHAAKGLEFPVVFVTGLEDGVFPSLRDGEDAEALEEERRLAYVAITRAARAAVSHQRARAPPVRAGRAAVSREPLSRRHPRRLHRAAGAAEPRPAPRPQWSRGGGEAEMTATRTETRDGGIRVEYDGDAAGYDDAEAPFHLGQRVRHPMFGEGEVRGFTGSGRDLKLTVFFKAIGPKTIIARFVEVRLKWFNH